MCFQWSTNNFNQLWTPFREDKTFPGILTMGIVHSEEQIFSQWKAAEHEELLPPTSSNERFASLGNKHSWENPNKKWHRQGLQLLPPLALSSGALKNRFISCRKLSSLRAFPPSFSTAETVSCIYLKATPQTEEILLALSFFCQEN